jgi:hypothetical protein
MDMDNNSKTYTLEDVELIIKNASIYSVNGVFLLDTEITDDPFDYDDSDDFALAQECFLRFSRHESEWEEVNEIWFPRNRNQEVLVKHGFIFYLYDNFGVDHEVIAYSANSIQE